MAWWAVDGVFGLVERELFGLEKGLLTGLGCPTAMKLLAYTGEDWGLLGSALGVCQNNHMANTYTC